jgi:hypothetical protein
MAIGGRTEIIENKSYFSSDDARYWMLDAFRSHPAVNEANPNQHLASLNRTKSCNGNNRSTSSALFKAALVL